MGSDTRDNSRTPPPIQTKSQVLWFLFFEPFPYWCEGEGEEGGEGEKKCISVESCSVGRCG